MARKRKAPSSQQTPEQKPKTVKEEPVKEEEEEEVEEETSEEEEEDEEEEEEEEAEEESSSEEEDESDSESGSDDEEDKKRDTLRELLEPFGKAQIIDLLKDAAAKDPNLLSKIVQVADADPTHRNVFVHGLGWDATAEQLLQAFNPFGEIEECKLITNKNTGRAKGYAFVLFKTRAAAKKALKVPQKKIGSRNVSCQLAAAGPPAGPAAAAADGGSRKIYVGNVGPNVGADKLRAFFERFGEIEEGPFGLDLATNKFKGFAVFTYKTPEGYKKALEEPIKVFENCQLHCKKFVENHNKSNVSGQSNVGSMINPAANDISYGSLGASGGFLGSNLSGSGLLMAQNIGMGLTGNTMMPAGYNPPFSAPFVGLSGNYGINSMTPSVMGGYGSQAALHGLGAFQNAQTGQSSIGTAGTAIATTRAPSTGVLAPTTYPSYFGR